MVVIRIIQNFWGDHYIFQLQKTHHKLHADFKRGYILNNKLLPSEIDFFAWKVQVDKNWEMSGASGLVPITQLCIWPRLTGTPSLDTFRLVQLGPHCTGPLPRHVQSNLDLTVHPLSPTEICSIELVRLGLHCTEPPQTCLNFFTLDLTVQGTHLYSPPPTFPDMKHIQLASEQLATYWNAFLLLSWLNSRLCVAWWLGDWGCGGREWGRGDRGWLSL